jgi:hypothetical protein
LLRAQKIEISPEKIVALTYGFDATTVYWPNAKSFDWQKEYWDMSPRSYWYAAGHYSASEHGGPGGTPLTSRPATETTNEFGFAHQVRARDLPPTQPKPAT